MSGDDYRARREWFERYAKSLNDGVLKPAVEGVAYTCPCCGYPTLSERGAYEICSICDWEDDGQDDPRADEVWGGPNGQYSLSEARGNFQNHLTMYRPQDSEGFDRATTPAKLQKKRALIAELEAQLN